MSTVITPPVPYFGDHYNNSDLVRTVAKAAFKEANEDWPAAMKLVRAWINADEELYRAIAEPLITLAIRNAISECGRGTRHSYYIQKAQPSDALVRGHRLAGRLLLDYPLNLNGRSFRLRDATKADLTAIVALQGKQIKTMAVRTKYYSAIAKRLDTIQTVEQVFTEEDLQELSQRMGVE